jgi:hypothetical protein
LRTVRMVVPCQGPDSGDDMIWKTVVAGLI